MINDLSDYRSYSPTQSCYLDGRYFNKVFQNYPGLLKNPLNIYIKHIKVNKKNVEAEEVKYNVNMSQSNINKDYIGMLRVIINTPTSRHSNLLLLDYTNKKVYRFEPLGDTNNYINNIIKEYLEYFMVIDEIININNDENNEQNTKCTEKGLKSGYCMAYIIKFGYDYLLGKDFDPTDIRRFANKVESSYVLNPDTQNDIEYGNDGTGQNVLIGGLGGAAIGGLLTGGPAGLLLGGLAGGAIGYGLSK